MPEQPSSGQGGGADAMDILWIGAAILGALAIAWYFGKAYITNYILHLRYYEIVCVDFFANFFIKFAHAIGLPVSTKSFLLPQLLEYVRQHFGTVVSIPILVTISTEVGKYLRFPLAFILFGLAAVLYFSSKTRNLRHIFDTKTLKVMEQENWPQISPVLKLDLVSTKLDDGPWAMAESPMKFCKKYKLLDVEHKEGKYIAKLKKGAAFRVLSLQLGPKWRSPEALPIHLKALFAVFAARIDNDKKSADALLDQIAASASGPKLDFTGVDALMRKHMNNKKVQKITILHGYVTTVFASLLVGAREVGVLAGSEFIWLKPIDRRMWYMLNTVGRQTAVAEIVGAYAHWLAEKKLGLPLVVPMVDEGVRGLESALSEILYKPDEED